jgi:hypothetical protein
MKMSAPPYIYRLDLQTGSGAEVRRSDFTDKEIAAARAVIDQAIAENQTTPVLIDTVRQDTWLTIADGSTARRLHAVIWYGQGSGRWPALTLGLALRSWPGSAKLYRELLGGDKLPHQAAMAEPPSPWLAVRAEVPLDGVRALIRYPSVLAWAWIEHTKSARLPL